MSFGANIANYAKKTKLSIDDAISSINLQLATDIISNTPRDLGRAQGNWNASLQTIDISVSDTREKEDAISDAETIAKKSAGEIFYLTNNLDYIYKIEFGTFTTKPSTEKTIGGFSIQAPQGMVRKAVRKAKNDLKKF